MLISPPPLQVRLQTQNGQYRNAVDCLIKTLKHERVSGLYKGVASPLLGVGLWYGECRVRLLTS